MNTNSFQAPWGNTLRWMTLFSGLLLVTVAALVQFNQPEDARQGLAALPLLLLAGAALFIVRRYTIEPNELLIQRLLWVTRLPLAGLQTVTYQPNAMRGSFRLLGNGGMFSITGLYRNRALGNYRAFVTDLKRTVVLRFAKRTVIVSPENPEQFVEELSRFAGRA
jgi:hypothetical protein